MTSQALVWALVSGLGATMVLPSSAQRRTPVPTPAPSLLWQVDGEGRGRPAADSTTAFFLSKRHAVLALDAATGSTRWKQGTGEPGDSTQGSGLTVAGSVVVAGDYNLTALDRRTGALRWHFVPALGYAPGIYLGESAGGLVFAGSPSGRVYAITAETGFSAWTSAVVDGAAVTVFPPVTDGHVVAAGYTSFGVPHSGGVSLFDMVTGRQLWRRAFAGAADPLLGTGSAGGPIIADGVVVSSSGNGTVYGLDRTSGSVIWTLPPVEMIPAIVRGPLPLPATSTAPDYRPLARWGKTLVVGSLKGNVVAYDLTTRRERWRYLDRSNGSVAFGIAVDDRSVYVPFVSGRHVALALSNGTEQWRTSEVVDRFHWPAAWDRSRIYLAGEKGGFVALRR